MLLTRKAQSTAEYAIVIGLVVAVAAGVLGVALKGGMREKSKQSTSFLRQSGVGTVSDAPGFLSVNGLNMNADMAQTQVYHQEVRSTEVNADSYRDRKILYKGGAEQSIQQQETRTTAISTETFNAVNP